MDKITTEQLGKHQTKENGGVLYNQKDVIDISKFKHPGGSQQFDSFYGKDITQVFKEVNHSEDALKQLYKMKIGELVQDSSSEFFTKEEVAKHNTLQDGWVLYGNDIIDISEFGKKHPGGEQSFIEFLGGAKDMTEAYREADHSGNADQQLKKYKIGELNQKIGEKMEKQEIKNQKIDVNKGMF